MTEDDELYQSQVYRLGHKHNVDLINNEYNFDIRNIRKVVFSERSYSRFFKAIIKNILA